SRHLFARYPAAAVILAAAMLFVQPVLALDAARPDGAPAATAVAVAPNPSTDDLKSLLATLQDPAARQKLISQIQSLIELRQNAGGGAPPPGPPPPRRGPARCDGRRRCGRCTGRPGDPG